MPNLNHFPSLKVLLKKNLSNATRVPIADDSMGRAAVVIAVVEDPIGVEPPYFLLTRRASKMRKHAGQFALPGGKVDAGETVVQAALRELNEELGIRVDYQNVLGLLDDYPTRSGFCITPLIVWIDENVPINPNPDEVAEVYRIPLNELSSPNLVSLEEGESPDHPVLSINLFTIGHEIYAPTAAIIYQFFEVAINGNESRVAFYDEPKFAWD